MPKLITPLSAIEIKKAKPIEKNYKLFDGKGLYLLVKKSGSKIWRFDYTRPITKKRNTMSLGEYPLVSLTQAREKRDEYRAQILEGVDPVKEIKKKEENKLEKLNNTFSILADEWLTTQTYAENTLKKARIYLNYANHTLGEIPVTQIRAKDVIDACKSFEQKGQYETANRVKVKITQVLTYATAMGKTQHNVASNLKNILKQPVVNNRKAIVTPIEFAQLIQAIHNYNGKETTCNALKIAYLTFVRPGELRQALWTDIDFEKAQWCFTPPKTKNETGVELIVPLTEQSLNILKQQSKFSTGKYVFPALTKDVPMSDATINKALKNMGFLEQHTGHGFRASARTMLEEVLQFDTKFIEMQLGHQVKDINGTAYNRTKFINERTNMMQKWADFCDCLRKNNQN